MKASELRDKSLNDLEKLLAEAKKDLLDFKKSLAAGELANSHVIKKTRKEIAKLNLIIAEMKSNDNKKEDK